MAVLTPRSGLAALIASALLLAGCGSKADTAAAPGPKVVATTTWEAGFAKAAGATNVTVIVPRSVAHAPDYDPKPSDLAAVADADFVLFAPFEGFAKKITDAAGSGAKTVEVVLDNSRDKVKAEVTRLGELFGTKESAAKWVTAFDAEYAKLADEVKAAWPGGQPPKVVAQAFVGYAADLAGAQVLGFYGPEPITAAQVADLSGKAPQFVFENTHMSTGTVLSDSPAEQVMIVNYPADDLDLLGVYRANAKAITDALR
ncbi:metal ABC transporter substrate-binding protein [Umezawaea endophytica]|uniref:Metal ABC transporter substrate-binding protein n=1 Tax=Umezawaea endophytica TaxID=1654476 RepID=A0A9X2VF15_9PSEU|nr:metal ABC transporter substrate-binding protein [Umezawaea endophytica]MCS7475421.1 metal ABC transporter substrate-binding protein [Umezawaea endophytica]